MRHILVAVVLAASAAVGSNAKAADQPIAKPSFEVWLSGVRAEAAERGLKPETIKTALGDIKDE